MAFQKEDTQDKVIAIIAEKLSMEVDAVAPEATFKDLGADSLDIMDMIMSFEESFGIQINDDDAEKIGTVAQAVELIHQARTK